VEYHAVTHCQSESSTRGLSVKLQAEIDAFLPTTIPAWNSLPREVIKADSLVHPMLPERCLSVLSVTFVYCICGQTVRRIKMKLGVQVGLGPGHIVLDRNPGPLLQRGTALPNFGPISVVAKWLDESRCHLVGT